MATAEVASATSSKLTPLISAIRSATYLTYAGSFRCPRWGVGAKYGESVSTSILSRGTYLATSAAFLALANVTGPAMDMKQPRFRSSLAISTLPE